MLKFIDLRKTPSLEIGMMMVFCYAPYALAEGLHLSGKLTFIDLIGLSVYTCYFSSLLRLSCEKIGVESN